MARLQLIFPLLFWVLWLGTRDEAGSPLLSPAVGAGVYACGLVAVVTLVAVQSAWAIRRTTLDRTAPVPRLHRTVSLARWFALAWHAAALWSLGYGDWVEQTVPDAGGHWPSLPTFASIMPLVVTWVGLIAAKYPVERGVREQNALYAVEFGEPVRPVPGPVAYLTNAVRSQVLFTLTPLLAIALARDGLAAAARALGYGDGDTFAALVAAGGVFALAPELLRRVLPTRSLPPSPTRERLDAYARRHRLGVRDILVWNTHYTIGNAAVMGVLPGVRYVLITDLLLDTMPPEELEAVFAHEAGHVVHRHIAWYVVFWIVMSVALGVAEPYGTRWLVTRLGAGPGAAEGVTAVIGIAATLVAFGVLSRRFERQADAFASRRDGGERPTRDGAAVFGSALRHVARLNNLPLDSRSFTAGRPLVGRVIGRIAHHAATWLHGSIRSRIDHVAALADQPAAAGRFERTMALTRFGLLAGLIGSAIAYVRLG